MYVILQFVAGSFKKKKKLKSTTCHLAFPVEVAWLDKQVRLIGSGLILSDMNKVDYSLELYWIK